MASKVAIQRISYVEGIAHLAGTVRSPLEMGDAFRHIREDIDQIGDPLAREQASMLLDRAICCGVIWRDRPVDYPEALRAALLALAHHYRNLG